MEERDVFIRHRLRTPRAAAIAGIVFALLLGASIVLFRLAVAGGYSAWAAGGSRRTAVVVATNLIPFAGIAFLWFMGVLRDRIGIREDKFFATVFLGSGLLFVALVFASGAVAMGLFATFEKAAAAPESGNTFAFGRNVTLSLLNVFALRMAAVFMLSTSAIILRTSVISKWLAYMGFTVALILLVGLGSISYVNLLMPLWVFMLSVHVLVRNMRAKADSGNTESLHKVRAARQL